MPSTNPTVLNRAGLEVQHSYLVAFLLLLCRYECMRMHTVAYAMFPTRAQTAAMAAAQRIVSNALKRNYIALVKWADGRRYYALTKKGAQFLNELDPNHCARSTVTALRLQNKEHRHWGILIAIASEQRGMLGFSESRIAGDMHTDITNYFGHVPDAVSIYRNFAMWHEVETSRRSTTRRAEASHVLCGAEKLIHLVQTLRAKRTLTHEKTAFRIALVMHCASGKIEREVRALVEKAINPFGGQALEDGYIVSCDSEDASPLAIIINRLPAEPELAWSGVLPWAACSTPVQCSIDRFIRQHPAVIHDTANAPAP